MGVGWRSSHHAPSPGRRQVLTCDDHAARAQASPQKRVTRQRAQRAAGAAKHSEHRMSPPTDPFCDGYDGCGCAAEPRATAIHAVTSAATPATQTGAYRLSLAASVTSGSSPKADSTPRHLCRLAALACGWSQLAHRWQAARPRVRRQATTVEPSSRARSSSPSATPCIREAATPRGSRLSSAASREASCAALHCGERSRQYTCLREKRGRRWWRDRIVRRKRAQRDRRGPRARLVGGHSRGVRCRASRCESGRTGGEATRFSIRTQKLIRRRRAALEQQPQHVGIADPVVRPLGGRRGSTHPHRRRVIFLFFSFFFLLKNNAPCGTASAPPPPPTRGHPRPAAHSGWARRGGRRRRTGTRASRSPPGGRSETPSGIKWVREKGLSFRGLSRVLGTTKPPVAARAWPASMRRTASVSDKGARRRSGGIGQGPSAADVASRTARAVVARRARQRQARASGASHAREPGGASERAVWMRTALYTRRRKSSEPGTVSQMGRTVSAHS